MDNLNVIEENREENSTDIVATNQNESAMVPFSAPLAQPQTVPDVNALCSAGPALPAPIKVDLPGKKAILMPSNDYLLGGRFYQDLAANQKFKNRKTKFGNMDLIHSFQPGLYIIVATTSSGKTTFSLQLADNLSSQGEYVIFFSLEQSSLEMISKSLSRCFYQSHCEDKKKNGFSNIPLYTSVEIRNGYADKSELDKQIDNYIQATQGRVFIVPCNFSCDVYAICSCAERFMEVTGQKPTVIIDYQQILAPITTPNGSVLDTKTSMDRTVNKLKQFQSEHALTIVTISSLSRQGYTDPIDMSNLKETGSLEYTADFVWGMQLSVVSEIANANTRPKPTEPQKRAKILKAKGENPRKIEIVYLKDRCGTVGNTVLFDYYPAYDTFVPLDSNGNPM